MGVDGSSRSAAPARSQLGRPLLSRDITKRECVWRQRSERARDGEEGWNGDRRMEEKQKDGREEEDWKRRTRQKRAEGVHKNVTREDAL